MNVLIKIIAIVSLLLLPMSISLWRKSHKYPQEYRTDITLYKSLWVSLSKGCCALELLSMPTKVASKSGHLEPLSFDPRPKQRSIYFSSTKQGVYRTTWLVFPFWLSTSLLTTLGVLPIVRGPVRQWWRKRHGRCYVCGYSLEGNRSGRCPECGTRHGRRRSSASRRRTIAMR